MINIKCDWYSSTLLSKIKEDLDEAFDGLIKGFNEQFEKSNKDFEKRSQEKLDRLLEEEKKGFKSIIQYQIIFWVSSVFQI